MPQQWTEEHQKALDRLTEAVKVDLEKGTPRETIVATLMKKGWDQATCERYVDNVQAVVSREKSEKILRRAGSTNHLLHMVAGLGFFAGGLVVTIGSYMRAWNRPGGGRVIFAYGAILFGFIDFVYGLKEWIKSRR